MTSPTLLKLLLVLIVFAIFYSLDKKIKGAVLAVLIYMIVPTPDDILIVPAIVLFLSKLTTTSLFIAGILYYTILGILILIVWSVKSE